MLDGTRASRGTMSLPRPSDQGRCVTCRYFAELPAQDNRREDRRHGQCRRFPPRDRLSGAGALWPIIQGRQWCGEYVMHPDKQREPEGVEEDEG